MIKPWQIQSATIIQDCRIFRVRRDLTVNPRTGKPHEMYVTEHGPWVNIVPLTPDNHVVLVEQWRHGTRTVELETPGGLVDPGESPEDCGRRELLEETGYRAAEIVPLGQVYPNPALQNNVLYYLLARGCRLDRPPALDHAEDISVRLIPLTNIEHFVQAGQIRHSLVIGAFYWLNLCGSHLGSQ